MSSERDDACFQLHGRRKSGYCLYEGEKVIEKWPPSFQRGFGAGGGGGGLRKKEMKRKVQPHFSYMQSLETNRYNNHVSPEPRPPLG